MYIFSNLNGPYHKTKTPINENLGIFWGNWYNGKGYSLKACKMLIRPHDWKAEKCT